MIRISGLFVLVVIVCSLWAATCPAAAEVIVYDNLNDFLAATQAEPLEPIPELGKIPNPPTLDHAGLRFRPGPAATEMFTYDRLASMRGPRSTSLSLKI